MKSMTGYGRAVWKDGNTSIEVEIRCVNGRFFVLATKIPPEIAPYEMEIKKIIADKISRGTINVTVYYTDTSAGTGQRINVPTVRQYFEGLKELAQNLGEEKPSWQVVMHLPGVIQETSVAPLDSAKWQRVADIISKAMESMEQMRSLEGEQLGIEIRKYLSLIEEKRLLIEGLSPKISESFHDRLKSKMQDLASIENFTFTKEDILREAAFFCEKADISEEVVRLKSHIFQFQQNLEKIEPVGKTMEFILQEMLREANTIGSKANHAECARLMIELKSLIEKVREQIQNIE